MVVADTDEHLRAIRGQLVDLRSEVAGVDGALVATTDGHPIVSTLENIDATSTAAMVAATLGLGTRLAELLGDSVLDEATVKTASGYVCVYAIGTNAVLTVFATAGANLARINHAARLRLDGLSSSARALTGGTS